MSGSTRPDGEPLHAARLKPVHRQAADAQAGSASVLREVRAAPELEPTWDDAGAAIDGRVAEALDDLHDGGFSTDEATAESVRARLVRIAQDHSHIAELRAGGFKGPRYELFKTTLAMYGDPVMRAWIRRRQIWGLTAANCRAVKCSEAVRDHLTCDMDDRVEVALEVVANALKFFHEHALLGGKWTPEGGANITTYFAGACVAVFPNVFRSWLREYNIDRGCGVLDSVQLNQLLDPRIGEGPEDRACNVALFEAALKAAKSDRLQHALASLVITDARYAEIAIVEGTSEDAIKQEIYRFRRNGEGRVP